MKNRNSGLGCGCSGGGDVDLGFVTPNSTQVVRYAVNPMTATLTTGRAAAAIYTTVSPSQLWLMHFREGMAFGVAWTASLEQGRTIPAQWHHDLERVALTIVVPVSPAGEIGSNRSAFVSGFDFGVRIAMERRTSFRAPNGRVYTLDFLRTQGTVAANTLFGQTRRAVLPAVSATSTMPMTPGVVAQRSTYEQWLSIAQSARAANVASLLSLEFNGTGTSWGIRPPLSSYRGATCKNYYGQNLCASFSSSDLASQWILFLMGNKGNLREPPVPPTAPNTYDRVVMWALDNPLYGTTHPLNPYLQAISSTTWVPQAPVREYRAGTSSR